MPIRLCSVSFRDVHGVQHAIDVHAESVLEAAALGVRELQKTEILDDEATFDITVELVTTTKHTVAWKRVRDWLDSNSPNPRTHARKAKLRQA